MENLRYYLSVFRRRLPWFLIVATVLSAVSVTVAYTLPPAYESQMVLLVESPQIPEELASSTVRTPAYEQLQIVQTQLLTRDNLLAIARKVKVLPKLNDMSPDEIVSAMKSRTTIKLTGRRSQEAPFMTVTFEAPSARAAAAVLNEYLILIQQQDATFRKGRAGETLDFFQQEVEQLSQALDVQSAKILDFKQANAAALPESLQYRLDQQSVYQDRIIRIDRDIADLKSQRTRLLQLYELTGNVTEAGKAPPVPEKSADEQQLEALKTDLQQALAVYSPENPRVKLLQARIAQLEEKIAQTPEPTPEPAPEPVTPDTAQVPPETDLPPVLKVQLTEIDDRIAALETQQEAIRKQLETLNESIAKTPEVSIALEEMNRKYASLEARYNAAEARLAKAQTGDRIETRSRGQRLTVIEQPAVPTEPTKPNRIKIAGAGTILGLAAGGGLIYLLELLNTSARRPADIVSRLGITPLTTIPYIETRGQRFRHRSLKLLIILVILIGIPAAVYLVHVYYLPLDLLADKVMDKLGFRL